MIDPAILRALYNQFGRPIEELNEFAGRKFLQKMVYLLQNYIFREDAWYSYARYPYGPYSAGLSEDYWKILRVAENDVTTLSPAATEMVNSLKGEFDGFSKANDLDELKTLELLATALFELKDQPTEEEAVKGATKWKKEIFTEAQVKAAVEFLKEQQYYADENES